ncbi:MAG: hypothetical protein U0521_18290 [Anaerolineae bacterium]
MSPLLNAKPSPLTERTFTVPAYSGRLRLIALAYGALLLFWSSLEDNSVLPVALLGGGLALLALSLWLTRRYGGRIFAARTALLGAALAGAAFGLAASLAVAVLMLIKDGLHSHLFPDYPFGMIVDILTRAPLWALAGSFAGIRSAAGMVGDQTKENP